MRMGKVEDALGNYAERRFLEHMEEVYLYK